MKHTNVISHAAPASISHLDAHDIERIAMNLMCYCTSDFLMSLKAHYQGEQATLTSEYNLSAEFLALGHWVSDMHCFSHDAFTSEAQLTHELLNRQEGYRGMLELESVYSLASLVGDKAESEIVAIASVLLDVYPIDSDAKHLVSQLGTGNEYTNFAALLTWVERQIVMKKLNNETYGERDFFLRYLDCITEREQEVLQNQQVPHDAKIH
ncbi:MAG: hypothetical protein ACQEQ2_05655 [Pseudomonadota bacterium]